MSNHCLAGTDNCHPNATCTSLLGPTFKCACKEERNYFGNGTHCFGKSYRYMWFFSFSPPCSNSRCFIHVFATAYVLSLCFLVIFTYFLSIILNQPHVGPVYIIYLLNARALLGVYIGPSAAVYNKDQGPIFFQYDSEQALVIVDLLQENTRKSLRRGHSRQCPVQYLKPWTNGPASSRK